MDRLRAYEIFATVVARESFVKAAQALDTSPANVTRYVGELEASLGARLLNRTSRRLSLTEAGRALYDRIVSILGDVAEAEAITSSAAVQPRGRLRIKAPVSFGIRTLAPLWPDFMAHYPEIELDVSLIDRVVDLVEEGYDLGIRISQAGSMTNISRRLATSRNLIAAAPDYIKRNGAPQMPADLARHDCIGYSYSATGDVWRLEGPGGAHEVAIRAIMHTNNGDTARAAAVAGRGIVRQPTFLLGDDLRAGRLVPLLPDYKVADIDISAIYPSRRHLSAKVRVMVDFLADSFRGTPAWDN